MSTSINSNISALVAQSNLRLAGGAASRSIAALSSGKRIIRAADDVAGLSIGTVLRTNVSTLKTALGNTRQANSLLQIADGGLSSIGEILQRQASLATQAKSGSLSDTERGFLNQEFTSLTAEIDRLVTSTKFNQVVLLDGSLNDAARVVSDTRTGDTDADGNVASTDTGDALGLDRTLTSAAVNFGDSLVTALALDNTANTGVFNNADFIGTLDQIQVTYIASNNVLLEVTVGDIAYTLNIADTTAGTATAAMIGVSNITNAVAGGGFDITLIAQTAAVTSQALADDYAERIRTAFSTVTVFQNRILSSYDDDAAGIVYDSSGTTIIGDLQASSVQLQLEDFSDVNVESVSVVAPTGGGTLATIEVVINGEIYRNTAIAGGTVGAAATLTLTSTANQDHTLIFTNSATALDFSSEENASYVKTALEEAFGVKQGGSALQFQIGSTSNEIIAVGVQSASSESLFDGLSLSVDSSANAAEALTQINVAITSVTSLRATVGALQSRFDYAAASIETAIQNQDAARGLFLDADVAEESTKFSNAQVLLQASISVLAQANQLPQNLLKLIG